jgi:hydrogenase maturation protease
VLIIGYGNPLRGDDAMGLVAAERLGGLAVHQLTPELAEPIAHSDAVIFLDADVTVAPGEISVKPCGADLQVCAGPPGPARPKAGPPIDHVATPDALLQLAHLVYGTAPTACLIGMGGVDFELREGLSAAAERAVERAVEFVKSSY